MTAVSAAPLGTFVSLPLPVVTVMFVDSATATSLVRKRVGKQGFSLIEGM